MCNTMLHFVSVSSFTAYIIVIFRVSVSVRLWCHLANTVSVRHVYRPGE